MRLEIYGGSDDLIEVEGSLNFEFNVHGDDGISMGTMRIISVDKDPYEMVRVHCLYDSEGCWSFAVAPAEDGASLPNWDFMVVHGTCYSSRLVVSTGNDKVRIEMYSLRGEKLSG